MSDVFIGCIRETLLSSEGGEFWAFNLTCNDYSYVIGKGMGELKFFEVSSLLHRLTFMDETIFMENLSTLFRYCQAVHKIRS